MQTSRTKQAERSLDILERCERVVNDKLRDLESEAELTRDARLGAELLEMTRLAVDIEDHVNELRRSL